MLPSFFTICNIYENILLTKSLTFLLVLNKSLWDFWMSKPWNIDHSSNAFFTHNLMCLFKNKRFTIVMINKIKTNNNLMTTEIIKRINYRRKICIRIFKIRRDNKVKKMHKHIFLCFKIQLSKIKRKFNKIFMEIISSITRSQKIIINISNEAWCRQFNQTRSKRFKV